MDKKIIDLKQSIIQVLEKGNPVINALAINNSGNIIFPNQINMSNPGQYQLLIGKHHLVHLSYTFETIEELNIIVSKMEINPRFYDEIMSHITTVQFNSEEIKKNSKIQIISPYDISYSNIKKTKLPKHNINGYSRKGFYTVDNHFRHNQAGLPVINNNNQFIGVTAGGSKELNQHGVEHYLHEAPVIIKSSKLHEALKEKNYI